MPPLHLCAVFEMLVYITIMSYAATTKSTCLHVFSGENNVRCLFDFTSYAAVHNENERRGVVDGCARGYSS